MGENKRSFISGTHQCKTFVSIEAKQGGKVIASEVGESKG